MSPLALRARLLNAILAAALLTTAGCRYKADPPNGQQSCAPGSRACPDGYTCGTNDKCYRIGGMGGEDAGVAGGQSAKDGGFDAPATDTRKPGDGGEGCGAFEILCGSRCVDLQSDSSHCGSCGNDCSLMPNVDKAICKAGVCAVEPGGCRAGFAHCTANAAELCETDVTTPERCGSCTNACPVDKANCSTDGTTQACSATCGGNSPDQCGAKCVNLKSDQQNCGACGKACVLDNAEATCGDGACKIVRCKPGYADCTDAPGCETPLGTGANCSKCGDSCDFAGATSTCASGKCSTPVCKPGFADCDTVLPDCETALGSSTNCAGCGMGCGADKPICASANGTFSCVSDCSAAAPDKCEGRCVNTKNDALHCGSCGNACSFPNAGAACVDGQCKMAGCKTGFADCTSAAGCETPLGTNVSCGKCGDACDFANATSSCNGSSCSTPVCKPGFANCDKSNPDCETAIGNVTNCSGCGLGCSEPTPVCSGSGANFSCVSDCTASAPTKCGTQCVNTKTDVNNCGGCGNPKCSFPNAAAYCDNGVCKMGQCNPGYKDCGSGAGCETPIGTDSNCSGCNDACTFAHATSSCNGTSCTTPVCTAGWAKCPGQSGCDTQLGTVGNCTGCGQGCAEPTPVCSGSGSVFSCVSNCTASAPDKCGTQCLNLKTDVNNCGKCGTACAFAHAGASCVNGVCTMGACTAGYDNCNGSPGDGCETQRGTNSNCSGCGDACTFAHASGSSCNGTSCSTPICDSGWAHCTGARPDCETDVTTNTNCGICGRACSGGTTCQSGACRGEVRLTVNSPMTGTIYNNGTAPFVNSLSVGDGDNIGSFGRRSVLTFDLSPSVPAGASIESATLELFLVTCFQNQVGSTFPSQLGSLMVEPRNYNTLAEATFGGAPDEPGVTLSTTSPPFGSPGEYRTASVTNWVASDSLRASRQAQFRVRFSAADTDSSNSGIDRCGFAPPANMDSQKPYLRVRYLIP